MTEPLSPEPLQGNPPITDEKRELNPEHQNSPRKAQVKQSRKAHKPAHDPGGKGSLASGVQSAHLLLSFDSPHPGIPPYPSPGR